MRHAHWLVLSLLAAASLGFEHAHPASSHGLTSGPIEDSAPSRSVPTGTPIDIELATGLSSGTAHVGSVWSGIVRDGREGIPTGSSVIGTVTAVLPARKNAWPMLDLDLTMVVVAGRACPVRAETEVVIGGSSRARALGACSESTTDAGATSAVLAVQAAEQPRPRALLRRLLLGEATAATVAPAVPREQIVLRPGVTLRFTTVEPARVRRQG